ncbi:MAG: FUSC family protein [Deltaproteobacteria bacterium]|nr:FUSC family protein [Deltaproteobacteria bacterium]
MIGDAMVGIAQRERGTARPVGWFNQLESFLSRELAPNSRKLRSALRLSTIGTVGAGVIASCHIHSEFGTYLVWLLVGAGPMMSLRTALTFLVAEAVCLTGSVMMARALAETPWLMLGFVFLAFSFSTYLGTVWKLGAPLLLIEVVCLNTFYGVVFAPQQIGWDAANDFGGSVIAFGVMVLFDNWLWPDPGEGILMKAMGASVARARVRFLEAAGFYLDHAGARRPPVPPPTSDLPALLTLLDQAVAEGVSEHRGAILLAAITRVARIALEVDRSILAVRDAVRGEIRSMVRSELESTVEATANALRDFATALPTEIPVGPDNPPPSSVIVARSAMDALSARVRQVRPVYVRTASSAEIEDFASFTDSLAAMIRHLERLIDEPPRLLDALPAKPTPRLTAPPDPAAIRYSLKVGLCIVVGYTIGLVAHRAELSTVLTTVLITALPTYGASLRKMILRIVGATLGGAVSLVTIMIVSPNFETLPAYMIAVFVVFYISAYSALGSGRIAYAGKQIGTTFALVFAGLSPSVEIYEPLWRIWSILLGTLVAGTIDFMVWPEYAGDSLLPRLRMVIGETLALMPGGAAAATEDGIQQANSNTMRILAEILGVAEDAQVEGRSSRVDHNAIVEAASYVRRIANRLSTMAHGHLVAPSPPLDPVTERERADALAVLRHQLESWLELLNGPRAPTAEAARSVAQVHSAQNMAGPLNEFARRLEEDQFSRLRSWTTEQRRMILAELQSLRRLEYLMTQLNRWLAQVPGTASTPAASIRQRQNIRPVPARPE